MTVQRITKRIVDALQSKGNEFTVWDNTVIAFGVRQTLVISLVVVVVDG